MAFQQNNFRQQYPIRIPLVSCLVTSYNHKMYIKQCIDSLLAQTYPNIEIIVCDDHSNDGSYEVLQQYADKITLLRNDENIGAIKTLNKIIQQANGDYIYRIDSDDYLTQNHINDLVQTIHNSDYDLVVGNLLVIDGNAIVDKWEYKNIKEDIQSCIKHVWEVGTVPYPHNGLFKASFLKQEANKWVDFDEGWGCDVITTLTWSRNGISVGRCDSDAFCWRIHGGNNTANAENRVSLRINTIKYIVAEFPEMMYLDNLRLLKHKYMSPEYIREKNIMILDSIKRFKAEFAIPAYLKSSATADLASFDSLIERYTTDVG